MPGPCLRIAQGPMGAQEGQGLPGGTGVPSYDTLTTHHVVLLLLTSPLPAVSGGSSWPSPTLLFQAVSILWI